MADEDTSSAEPGKPGSPGDPDVPADAPPGEKAEPIKSQDDSPKETPEETLNKSRQKAYIEQLEHNYYQSAQRGEKMFAQLQGSLNELMKLANAPAPKAPVPYALPAPPTQQQKGNLSEWAFNLLKFGALAAIAYGASGRGYGHNAIYKGALGAALQGYVAGRKDVVNASMQLWEKNREIINQANRDQNQRYKDILADRRLDLTQKMDIINGLSRTFGDYRTWQDSLNKNLMDLQKSLQDQDKVQRDKEEWENKHRDKVYNVLGKNNITAQYLEWVYQKSGGKVSLTQNSPVEEWRKAESEHPELAFSEFLKWHEQEETRKATEKAGSEEAARQKAKKEAAQGPAELDPNAPLSEDKAKEMRSKIFGE